MKNKNKITFGSINIESITIFMMIKIRIKVYYFMTTFDFMRLQIIIMFCLCQDFSIGAKFYIKIDSISRRKT